MIKQKIIILVTLTLILTNVKAQIVNKLDAEGKYHGHWKKNYEGTDQIRYEGVFEHGKEHGLFKFYKIVEGKSVLSATKNFNLNSNIAQVKFYSSKEKVISEGEMDGKFYIGKWVYYHSNSSNIMTIENYNNKGELHGEKIVYYDNGIVAEESIYKNGLINGIYTHYTLNGKHLKILNYIEGKLHGNAKYYDEFGELIVEGNYVNDQKKGLWKYYDKGQLINEKRF